MFKRHYRISLCLMITVAAYANGCDDSRIKQKQPEADPLIIGRQQELKDSLRSAGIRADTFALAEKRAEIEHIADKGFDYSYDEFRKIGWFKSHIVGIGIHQFKERGKWRMVSLYFQSVIRHDGEIYFGVFYREPDVAIVPIQVAVMIRGAVTWSQTIPAFDQRNSMETNSAGSGGHIWFKDGADNGIFEAIGSSRGDSVKFRLESESSYREFDLETEQIDRVKAALRLSQLLRETS